MSVNIRDYVSNDHIESIGEIAKSQSAIIQALSIDNSKLQQELHRKDNIINGIKEELNKNYNTYVCKNKSYGKTFKAGAEVYKEHLLYIIKKIEDRYE